MKINKCLSQNEDNRIQTSKRRSFETALAATARIACCASLMVVGCNTPKSKSLTLEECQTEITKAFAGKTNKTTEECCQMTAEYYDDYIWDSGTSNSELDPNWAYRDECCELLDWTGSMTCTPWGPPTPPAMPLI
jgi:hypothetical protein